MPNITKRGDAYRITVSLGVDGKGNQRRKYLTYKPPEGLTPKQEQKAVETAAREFEQKCINGEVLDQSTRFHDFMERWLSDYAEKQLKIRTYTRYRELLSRADIAFGNMKMKDIKPHHLNEFYNNLGEKGVRRDIKYIPVEYAAELIGKTGITQTAISSGAGVSPSCVYSCMHGKRVSADTARKMSDFFQEELEEMFTACEDQGLSGRTVKDHHTVLSSLFSTAVRWEVIPSNPCERVKPPKFKKTESRYLDENGAAALLAALAEEPYHYQVAICTLLYTGLRRGEVCGLEWCDIDFINNLLTVRNTLLYVPSKGLYIDEPKSESSKRVISLPKDLVELLKDALKWQKEQESKLGTAWIRNNNVMRNPDGSRLRPDTLSGWFGEFIKRHGLPDISLHSLRHTNATLMIAGGMSIKTVSARLGHSGIAITSDLYSHAIKSVDALAAETLNDILSPTKNVKKKLKLG